MKDELTALLSSLSSEDKDLDLLFDQTLSLLHDDHTSEQLIEAESLLITLAKALVSSVFNEDRFVQRAYEILVEIVNTAVEILPLHTLKNAELLGLLTDPRARFYLNHGAKRPEPIEPMIHASSEELEELVVWRRELGLYDKVDVFRNNCWKGATVVGVQLGRIRVSFEGIGSSKDEWIPQDSHRIVKFRKMSKEVEIEQWRRDLGPNSRCDVLDLYNKWYTATVISVNEADDTLFVNYEGWSAKFDEYVPRRSDRVAPYLSIAKGGRDTGGTNHSVSIYPDIEEEEFDDPNCAVFKGNCSYFLVDLINHFQKKEGFSVIFQRVSNHEPNLPIAVLKNYIEFFANISLVFSKSFSQTFIQNFVHDCFDTVTKLTDIEMRQLSKETLESITENLEVLLKRILKTQEVSLEMEKFSLQIALKRFQSPIFERRINGLTYINEKASQVRRSSYSSYNLSSKTKYWINSPENMIDWLDQNHVFDDIFGDLDKSHIELIKRSTDIVKLYAAESKFSEKMMLMIWKMIELSMTKNLDIKLLEVLYKLVDDLSYQINPKFLHILVENLSKLPYSCYQISTVEFLKEFARLPSKYGIELTTTTLELFWSMLISESGQSPKISSEIQYMALLKFEDILRISVDNSSKLIFIERCIQNIQKDVSAHQSLKLLMKILNSFSERYFSDSYSKSNVVLQIEERFNLIELLVTDICSLRGKFSFITAGKPPLEESLRCRLDMLSFMFNVTPVISESQISRIWNSVMQLSASTAERQILFQWLMEAATIKTENSSFSWTLPENVSKVIFSKTLLVDANSFTISEFTCFEKYFMLVNYSEGNIVGTSNDLATLWSNYNVRNFDNLVGMEALWNIVWQSSSEVFSKSSRLLFKLHESIDTEQKKRYFKIIRSRFLELCMNHLKFSIKERLYSGIEKVISLLNLLIDAAERSQRLQSFVGAPLSTQIVPHGYQPSGKTIEISVQNNVSRSLKSKLFKLSMYEDDTLGHLRIMIAKNLEILPAYLKIFSDGKELDAETVDAKTFRELKKSNLNEEFTFKNLIVTRNLMSHKSVELIDPSTKRMTARAKEVFTEIFNLFAEEGILTKEAMVRYIISCGVDPQNANDKRINQIFSTFGGDRDKFDIENDEDNEPGLSSFHPFEEFMNLDGFLSWYTSAIIQRPFVVWTDLSTHGYLHDLRKEKDVLLEELSFFDESWADPRNILCGISSNDEESSHESQKNYFDSFFEVFELESSNDSDIAIHAISEKVWNLIMRLPTNPNLKQKLFLLEADNSHNVPWKYLIDPTIVRRKYYSLQIIESFLFSNKEVSGKTYEEVLHWKSRFFELGGVDHILNLFLNTEDLNLRFRVSRLAMLLNLKVLQDFMKESIPEFTSIILKVDNDFQELLKNEPEISYVQPPSSSENGFDNRSEVINVDSELQIENNIPPSISSAHFEIKSLDISKLVRQTLFLMKELLISSDFELDCLDSDSFFGVSKFFAILFLANSSSCESIIVEVTQNNSGVLFSSLFSSNYYIRKHSANTLYLFSKNSNVLQNAILESLLSLLKKFQIDTKEEGNDYDMYFALLSHLIHRVFSNNSHTKLNLQEVFDHLSKQIINRGCHESSNSDKVDRFFSGICKLLSEIYPYIEPSNISDELFRKLCSDYLFISSLEDVKRNLPCCKSFASRRAAICLLVSMVSGSHVLSMNRRSALFELIFKHIKGLPQKYFQGNTPDFHRRSPLGFAGLKNQGNTCYLNSCIQQFFMMPKFRRSILNAPIDIKSVNLDDDMVHQLQVMFGFLCLTQKQAFDTISFCKTYKDEQGNPVDVRIQQDAQEFLNVFCDRIETKMKALGNADILNNFLKGKLINQMICLGGCGSIREKEEDFFSLSLQVNQKSDLEESLKSFVNPELVNGVSCEACGKKSDTHMRAVVGKLPETIIFHLKRFQLNFETFMNEKINDRFEFPMEINLEPFTKAGLARKEAFLKQQQKTTTETNQEDSKGENTSKDEHLNDKANENVENKDEEYSPDENCKYRLSGIVVHIGNAQAGHYYSFIRVRGSETWLEFNDNIVRKFDLKILSEEAFGGKLESDGKNWEMMLDNENIKNAYLLIYEKMNSESSPDALEKSNASSIESSTVETTISELIDLDNLQFLKESHIYSEDYFNLVLDLLKMNDVMSNNPMEATYLSFGIKFAFHIVARSIDCSMLAKFFDLFSYWFEQNVNLAKLFLEEFNTSVWNMASYFVNPKHASLRPAICKTLHRAFTIVYPLDSESFDNPINKSIIESTIDALVSIKDRIPKDLNKFSDFYGIFSSLSEIDPLVKHLLIRKGILSQYGSSILGISTREKEKDRDREYGPYYEPHYYNL